MTIESYRVCVVEDDIDANAALCEGLTLNQFEPVPAHTGAEALEACAAGNIDAVILDVCLPDISGYEVCRQLKANPKTADIPVLFCTVKGTEEDVMTGYQAGAADYITKPYNLPMVMIRVQAAIRNRSLQSQTRELHAMLPDTSYTDALTGLRTGRFMMERLQEEVEKAQRYDHPVSCIVFDVDEVHALDDELGPVSMDDLLVEVAMTLRNYSRTYDIVARYDGTVFTAVLPHSPMEDAKRYAEKIVNEITSTTFADPCLPTEINLSVGISTCCNGHGSGAEFVFGEAMRNLLEAKSRKDTRLVARSLSYE